MSDQPPTAKSNAKLATPTIACLLMLIALIVLQRLHTYSEPLENDIAGYAIIGHEMLHGRHLYSDLWERKPPLLYGIFAAAECITGYGQGEILLINITAAIITLLAVYRAGAHLSGSAGGITAAAMWTLLCGDLFMQANQPNAEVLLNAWLTCAFALLLQLHTSKSYLRAVLLGVCLAAATLIKHHVLITCAALAIGYVLVPLPLSRFRRTLQMLIAASIGIMGWLALFAYFSAVGRLHAMVDVLFHQNAQYAGSLLQNLYISLTPSGWFKPFLTWMICPLFILAVFIFFKLKQKISSGAPRAHWKLWCAWAIGTWPAVVLPGHLFPHYFQLWIPVLCIASGWASARILDPSLPMPSIVRYTSVAAALTVLACRELIPYRLTPDQWANQKYRGGNYVQQKYLGQYLGQTLLKPSEQFWVLGDDNSLYFYARHSPPTGLLYLDPLTEGNETRQYNQQLVNDLTRAKPELIILSPLAQKLPPDSPVFTLIHHNYRPWPTSPGRPHYIMFIKNQCELQHRLQNQREMGTLGFEPRTKEL